MNDGEDSTSTLYAWLSRDGQGVEGIVTVKADYGLLPLVVTDLNTALSMRNLATVAAAQRGNPVRLVRFERGITLDVQTPSARP